MRVADAADVLLSVLEQAGLRHDIDAPVLAGHQLCPTGANTVLQPEIGAILGHPHRPIRTIGDIGHAVLQLARCILGKECRGHPWHVEMTVSGYSVVAHCCSLQMKKPAGISFRRSPAPGKHWW